MSGSIGNRLERLERQQGQGSAPCGCDLGVRVVYDAEPEPESPWLCPHGHRYAEEMVIHVTYDDVPSPREATGP
jgi:hypothetical protein